MKYHVSATLYGEFRAITDWMAGAVGRRRPTLPLS